MGRRLHRELLLSVSSAFNFKPFEVLWSRRERNMFSLILMGRKASEDLEGLCDMVQIKKVKICTAGGGNSRTIAQVSIAAQKAIY